MSPLQGLADFLNRLKSLAEGCMNIEVAHAADVQPACASGLSMSMRFLPAHEKCLALFAARHFFFAPPSRVPGASPGSPGRVAYLLLLLPLDDFSPAWLLRLPVLPRPALARSLCAALFWVLALPPRLPASARLLAPRLEEDEDDFGLRDAIDISLDMLRGQRTMRAATG